MSWTLERLRREMKKFDPLLRVRESKLNPAICLIERKARRESVCVRKPAERRGMDAWICDKDGYVEVMRVRRDLLNHNVFLELRAHDMWETRGAGYFADMLEEQERQAELKKEREQSRVLHALGEEAYDRAMVKQGDVVSNFKSKVGGYEPGSNANSAA
jgi:hypothetical protein